MDRGYDENTLRGIWSGRELRTGLPSRWKESHLTRQPLPDLYWGTDFGAPSVELFGARRLAEAPVARCEEIAPGVFYVQLTDDLDDLRSRPEVVRQVSTEAKRFLGLEAFAKEGAAEPCARVPRFDLGA